jgi:hypothetical protein
MLMQLTLVLVISIFAINTFFQRPIVESFTFALALAAVPPCLQKGPTAFHSPLERASNPHE